MPLRCWRTSSRTVCKEQHGPEVQSRSNGFGRVKYYGSVAPWPKAQGTCSGRRVSSTVGSCHGEGCWDFGSMQKGCTSSFHAASEESH